jgi:amino acid transporter
MAENTYATSLFLGADAPAIWVKIFASAIVVLLTFINSIGAEAVTRAQTAIVTIVLLILSSFAIAMLLQIDVSMLAPSTYPPMSYILASEEVIANAETALAVAALPILGPAGFTCISMCDVELIQGLPTRGR